MISAAALLAAAVVAAAVAAVSAADAAVPLEQVGWNDPVAVDHHCLCPHSLYQN